MSRLLELCIVDRALWQPTRLNMDFGAQCDTSHTCFHKVGEPRHLDTHICFSKREPSKLDPFQAAAVVTALEDGIAKLQILFHTLPKERNDTEESPYRSIDERFRHEIIDPGKYWDFAGVWPMDVQALLKLQKDREFVERVLRKTLEDIRWNNRYEALQGAVDLEYAKIADEKTIEDKLRGFKKDEALCKELLSDEKELLIRQDAFWDQKAEHVLASYHDTQLVSGLTLSYARRWEETRRQQLNLKKQNEEADIQNQIDDTLEDAVVQEERAHLEIAAFLGEEHQTLKKELDRWTDEYDEQVTTRDAEFSVLRQNKDANFESIEQAKQEIEKRKEIKAIALELREKFEKKNQVIKQITTIQAWWRGIYYRKNLQAKAMKLLKKTKKKKKGKKKKRK